MVLCFIVILGENSSALYNIFQSSEFIRIENDDIDYFLVHIYLVIILFQLIVVTVK